MLQSHFQNYEEYLYQQSKLPDISSHPVNKGSPRESFIKFFLKNHLPSKLSIGSGELIDAHSKQEDKRPQHDIVIYKDNYPVIHLDNNITVFLIESVVATIEIKSRLSYEGILQATKAAYTAKQLTPSLTRSFHSGHIPPKILNFVLAYNGPQKMDTVLNWIKKSYAAEGFQEKDLPTKNIERTKIPSEALDGVFVLKKGFVYFDNVPFGFGLEHRSEYPKTKWVIGDTDYGCLFTLFLFLLSAMANIEGSFLNPLPYFANSPVNFKSLKMVK